MSQNVPKIKPFEWTQKAENAARLLAEDEINDEQIAADVDINRRTLTRWKTHPEFELRVGEYKVAYRERIFQTAISRKEVRIREKQKRHSLLLQVMAERAEDSTVKGIPGGKTGLIIRKEIPGKFGKIIEHSIDTGLLTSLSNLEKEVAVELGQITKKLEHSGFVETNRDLSNLSVEELKQLESLLEVAESAGRS